MKHISRFYSMVGRAMAVVMLGVLGALLVRFFFGALLPEVPMIEVMEFPDRFAELVLSEPPVERFSMDRVVGEQIGAAGTRGPSSAGEGARAKREEGKVGRKDARMERAMGNRAAVEPDEEILRDTLRSWFPETLLFAPLVVTDEQGTASVEVRVPDQLTRWRILGLAHDRAGRQAGAVTGFDSTMPVYVDLPEPPVLRVGDRVRLPVQVVNQRAEALEGRVQATVDGDAASGGGGQRLRVAGGRAALERVLVDAVAPGQASLEVALAGHDRVQRALTVEPVGRPLTRDRAGSLAGELTIAVIPPDGALPGASGLELRVFPGPVAVLEAELARVGAAAAGDLDEAAYAYALTGMGRSLGDRLGVELDGTALRHARLRAWQDLVRYTREPSLTQAVVVLAAARGWPDDPLAAALAQRLAATVEASQAPDGSFASHHWGRQVPVEQALVFTAEAARQTRDHEPVVAERARAFVIRSIDAVRDPYTAAELLAADLVDERHEDRLRAMVRDALETGEDGALRLPVPERARTAAGSAPTPARATALAVLALGGDASLVERRSALGATLLGARDASGGLGDGLDGLAVLEALAALFPEPLPEEVVLTASLDGQTVGRARLGLAAGFDPVQLDVPLPPARGDAHSLTLVADPPVPGLGFTLRETHWLPVDADPSEGAFALRVEGPRRVELAEPASLTLRASPPGGERLGITLALPAGVEPDPASLDVLEDAGVIEGWEASTGRLVLGLPPQPSGALFEAQLTLIPTIPGRLHWGAAVIALTSDASVRAEVVPAVWEVGS